jgi:hypothetical protein
LAKDEEDGDAKPETAADEASPSEPVQQPPQAAFVPEARPAPERRAPRTRRADPPGFEQSPQRD